MALAISTNFAINANTALNAMNKSQSLMGKSISRISTGNRAANPADDPLSYFSGNKIKGDTDGYQALYNGIQDGAARLNVADTALSSMIDVLTEMKSKAIAYNSTSDTDAQESIKKAYDQLYSSLATFKSTQYKGADVWATKDLEFTTSLGGSGTVDSDNDNDNDNTSDPTYTATSSKGVTASNLTDASTKLTSVTVNTNGVIAGFTYNSQEYFVDEDSTNEGRYTVKKGSDGTAGEAGSFTVGNNGVWTYSKTKDGTTGNDGSDTGLHSEDGKTITIGDAFGNIQFEDEDDASIITSFEYGGNTYNVTASSTTDGEYDVKDSSNNNAAAGKFTVSNGTWTYSKGSDANAIKIIDGRTITVTETPAQQTNTSATLPSTVDISTQQYVDASANKLYVGSQDYTLNTTAPTTASYTGGNLTGATGQVLKNDTEVGQYAFANGVYTFKEITNGSEGIQESIDTSTQQYVDASANKLYVGSTAYDLEATTTGATGTYETLADDYTGIVKDSNGDEVGVYKLNGTTYTFEEKGNDDNSTGAKLKVSSSDAIGDPSSDYTGLSDITKIDGKDVQDAIDSISNRRVALGGSLAAMDSISSYLSSMVTANDAAYTAVTEANIAKEMTSYVKNNVYSQAAQAMISQANQSLAQVLNLLQ